MVIIVKSEQTYRLESEQNLREREREREKFQKMRLFETQEGKKREIQIKRIKREKSHYNCDINQIITTHPTDKSIPPISLQGN